MKAKQYHTYHVSFIDPILRGLEEQQVSFDQLARRSDIRYFDVESKNTYLPINVYYQFLDSVKKELGIAHVSNAFYNSFKLEDLSDFGAHLSHQPDLYSILRDGIKYNYLVQTNGKLHLRVYGATSYFFMEHLDDCSVGRQISEKIELVMMIEAVQKVLGADWRPDSVTICGKDRYWVEEFFETVDFPVITNSLYMGFSLPTKTLSRRNPWYESKHYGLDENMHKVSDIVKRTMSDTLEGYLPNLNEFSSFFGVSRRTLIRSLASEGWTFSELLEVNLKQKSIGLLCEERNCIREVSDKLGYSNPSNFIRAFKKWTGTTPQQFREELVS